MSAPRCFDSPAEYALWHEAARQYSPGINGYCADCTPERQVEMRLQERCGYPDTKFKVVDGELVGVRSDTAKRKLRKEYKDGV